MLSTQPDPPPLLDTVKNIPLYLFTQRRGEGGGGGEPVRRLEGR
jgi:hypothetical protein